MAWLCIKIEASDEIAESLSDELMALGALSASIEDANAETTDEQPIFGEPGDPPPGIWQHNIVSALFDDDVDVAEVMQSLVLASGLTHLNYRTEIVAEQDWVRATQSQFNPIRIREDLWIVPSWHSAPEPEAVNIVLDPGLAFGTGSHPTTHLCLDWLANEVRADSHVLDYGCGSGILAIAAKKLGAATVVGTDIDPQAIQSSRYNALQNHVDASFYLPEDLPPQHADLLVANILSSALTVLAPALASACKAGGQIALSGVLRDQAQQVGDIYAAWFDMNPPRFLDGWALLAGTRR